MNSAMSVWTRSTKKSKPATLKLTGLFIIRTADRQPVRSFLYKEMAGYLSRAAAVAAAEAAATASERDGAAST